MSESGGEESIFTAALAKATPEQRAAFLDDACGSDADLRRRVEALFAAHEQTCGILDMPAAALRPMGGELSLNDSAVGTTLGPYKLLERIGEGGMGVVYMADQLSPLRRRVALKIIKPGLAVRSSPASRPSARRWR